MIRQSKVWGDVILAGVAIYGFALTFQIINEFFDTSSPRVEQAIVVQKFTRYNPVPISVFRVRNTVGFEYNVAVLPELATKLLHGAELSVVRKSGVFGKEWVEDRDFHELLNDTRTIQGFIDLALPGLLAICWVVFAKRRFSSNATTIGSLFAAVIVAFGVFWFLP